MPPARATARMSGMFKRGLDLVVGALALALTSPLIAIAAALIVLEDGRPVLHRRLVVGRGGREFRAYKLRTMRVDADAWLAARPELQAEFSRRSKLVRDPRVTRTGRTLRRLSIDELPQLVNVLRGQMSLVGPRIIHPSELPAVGTFAALRMSVRPGLTGLWQVSGRHELAPERRLELDREYVRRSSLLLDLQILARTPLAVLSGRGAY